MANYNEPDYYDSIAAYRLEQLDAAQARCMADLAQYKANHDYEGGAEEAQRLSNIVAERNNILGLHQQHAMSKIPMAPRQESREAKANKSILDMNANELMDLYRTSKHGKDLTWNDPNVREGCDEVAKRRARGE